MWNPSEPGGYVSIGLGLEHAFSPGVVHIASGNVQESPAIDTRYLSHPLDLELLAHATFHCEKLAATSPLADSLVDDLETGKTALGFVKPFTTMDEVSQYVKDRQVTIYHAVGTCAMLPRDEGGVVDTKLRVHGAGNMRVVDASMFPTNDQGNIVSLVYAVAEKASDAINAEYGREKAENVVNGVH